MLKKLLIIFFVIMPFLFSGCAYQKALEEQRMARQAHSMSLQNMPDTLSKAIDAIVKLFATEYERQQKVKPQAILMAKTYYDASGNKTHDEVIYAPENPLADIIIAEKKQKSVDRLFVEVKEIYAFVWHEPETTTWTDVANNLVKQGPLMLAIGAIWGVSTTGIENAGDFNNNGNYNTGNGQIGDTTTIDMTDSPITTTTSY